MNYLIVSAHTENDDFHQKMLNNARQWLKKGRHKLYISSLYELGFHNLKATQQKINLNSINKFNNDNFEQFSILGNSVEDRILDEIDKVAEADVIIFQYPMQWMNTPQILFNWINEVFDAFEPENKRWYDMEDLATKTFATAVTTAADKDFYELHRLRNGASGLTFALRAHLQNVTKQKCKHGFIAWNPCSKNKSEKQFLLNKFNNFINPEKVVISK